ncbi:hypothetical protein OO009_15390 [Flavobacteriaceae bacterium KMM 6897]|nr:hypothetical protein [Flavobacteriaceae bacterium KMM 6897]MEB8345733.1 hypothetical protein [Flavobacteriaceae bacterium KMM 6898]
MNFFKSNFIFLILLYPILSFAQISTTTPEGSPISFQTVSGQYKDVPAEGSPFISENFENGEIYVNEELKLKNKLRYNAYRNEIQILQADETFNVLLKRSYMSAKIEDRTYKLFLYMDNKNREKTGYFNPLNEGQLVLLFKPEIILKQSKEPETGYDKYRAAKYIENNSYYIKNGSENAYEIRLSKRSIFKIAKKNREEMNSFVKENNLNLRKIDDVIFLLNYYNTL